MEGSHQYRQIAAKWDISPEHPGIPVAPNLESYQHKRPEEVVGQAGHPMFIWTNSWIHLGPRFWDKPLNEGCLEKGAALLKYAALFSAYSRTFLVDLQIAPENRNLQGPSLNLALKPCVKVR